MQTLRRRALVLTDESAGHPFLRTLPGHVRQVSCAIEAEPKKVSRWSLTGADWRGFFSAYCVAFIVVSVFIA